MSKEQKKKDPRLFIQQPPFKPLKGKMQETFSLKQAMKNDPKPSGEKMPVEGGEKRRRSKGSFEQEEEAIFGAPNHDEVRLSAKEVQQKIEGYEGKAKGHDHGFSFQRLKPFKEMNVEEKLDYLANFPPQLPPVPCLFQTEGKAVRGILKEKNNREVIVKLFDKTESTILIKDLLEVRMVGM
ncbi:CotO family spore coat protein [Robertmurraya massiliosenegalensis]|uniref:CotO family spore coat protein n=1 Tax=Robertmurraya TaxID=2837507 RepID=UPI0039A4D072